jgi:hypothetical protein
VHQVKRLKAQVEAMTQRLTLSEDVVKEAEEKERMARREAARLQVKRIEQWAVRRVRSLNMSTWSSVVFTRSSVVVQRRR